MKKSILFILAAPAFAAAAIAADITGRAVDSSSEPLPGVSVRLLENDSVTRALAVADVDGRFSIPSVRRGDYALSLTMTGMDTVTRTISVPDTDSLINVGDITLTEASVTLKEAVVTAVKAAVVAKQDTLEFNAGSYATRQNSTVEDLLKKLPGVQVGSDGSITSNGKTVSKILVDGKEFFSDDPTAASKNLPSELVDKVQVVDRKSDLARITGVDDGEEETVINLTVKKQMKNGWFGTIGGGYGTDGRYEGSFNLSTFTNNQQISIIGGANNTNDLGFGDAGRGRFMNFGPSGGITSSQRIGLNFNVGRTDSLRFGGNIFYSHSDRRAISRTDTQYLFPDSVSYSNSGSNSIDRGHNVSGNFRLEWKIDANNTLDFRPSFSFNSRSSELNDTSLLRAGDAALSKVNSNRTHRFNNGTSWNADGNLIFNHNFPSRPGRSFSAQARYSFSSTAQRTTSWNQILYYLKADDSEDIYRYLFSRQWNNSVEGRFTWTEPLGDPSRGNFLQAAYRIQYRFNNADKDTYDIPDPNLTAPGFTPQDFTSIPVDAIFNTQLSNRFRNTFSTQELRLGYKKVHKKYNLEAGLVISPSSSESNDLIDAARNVPAHWVWNVAPFARFRYKFSKTSGIRADYRARTSSPSVSKLQPVADVSDPLNITVGNPDLKPEFTQTVGLHFNNYNAATQQSVFAALRGQYTSDVIVARTVTDKSTGARTTTYTNTSGNYNVMAMAMLNQPFRNSKFRFSSRMMANYTSSAGFINGDFNRSGNLNVAPNLGLTFSSSIFQMSVNPTYTFSMATNTLELQPNRYTHTYGFTADATLTLPFGLDISTDLSFDKSSGFSNGFNIEQWLWNAQISYSFLRDRSLTVYARAYDILGQNKNISRSVSADMISDNSYNDLTRYVMVGVTWTFNTMKKKKTAEIPEEFDGPPGPPPGDSNGERPEGRPGGFRGGPMGPPPGHRMP